MGRFKAMTLDEAQRFVRAYQEHVSSGDSINDIAKAMNIAPSTLRRMRAGAEHTLGVSLASKNQFIRTPSDVIRLSSEERAELARLRGQSEELDRLHQLFRGGLDHTPAPPPWMRKAPAKPKCLGTPTLFLSDLHWGECVDPKQINGVNQYDMVIARKRLKRVANTAITMLMDHLQPGGYPGMVLALGGDIVSGNIHEELRETNADSILAIVLDVTDHLIAVIEMMLDAGIPHVFVPCVVGNHGRLDKKPRAKGAVQDNYEWIIYQLLLRHYAKHKRVTVVPSDSLDYVYQLHNTTYLLTHGDQFRGGSGISGPATPWALGDHKKRKRQNAIDQPYDYMIFGHFHMLSWGQSYIVNGTLKGYDEYSFRSNFGYEPPQQALWITHPTHGITVKMEIGAEDNDNAPRDHAWIKVRGS